LRNMWWVWTCLLLLSGGQAWGRVLPCGSEALQASTSCDPVSGSIIFRNQWVLPVILQVRRSHWDYVQELRPAEEIQLDSKFACKGYDFKVAQFRNIDQDCLMRFRLDNSIEEYQYLGPRSSDRCKPLTWRTRSGRRVPRIRSNTVVCNIVMNNSSPATLDLSGISLRNVYVEGIYSSETVTVDLSRSRMWRFRLGYLGVAFYSTLNLSKSVIRDSEFGDIPGASEYDDFAPTEVLFTEASLRKTNFGIVSQPNFMRTQLVNCKFSYIVASNLVIDGSTVQHTRFDRFKILYGVQVYRSTITNSFFSRIYTKDSLRLRDNNLSNSYFESLGSYVGVVVESSAINCSFPSLDGNYETVISRSTFQHCRFGRIASYDSSSPGIIWNQTIFHDCDLESVLGYSTGVVKFDQCRIGSLVDLYGGLMGSFFSDSSVRIITGNVGSLRNISVLRSTIQKIIPQGYGVKGVDLQSARITQSNILNITVARGPIDLRYSRILHSQLTIVPRTRRLVLTAGIVRANSSISINI